MEFAVSIPILITFIWYIHDISKMACLHERAELIAREMVNMLQNVSQNRENKKLTSLDVKYAAAASYLSAYPGVTMYGDTSGTPHPFGHFPLGYIHCVKGEGGKAKVLWHRCFFTQTNTPNMNYAANNSYFSTVALNYTANSLMTPSSIHKDLQIKDGEIKIILQYAYFYNGTSGSGFGFNDGRLCRNVSVKDAFGFLVVNPKPQNLSAPFLYFHAVVIFTPKPGLFGDAAP
jgi:hypothetical protein